MLSDESIIGYLNASLEPDTGFALAGLVTHLRRTGSSVRLVLNADTVTSERRAWATAVLASLPQALGAAVDVELVWTDALAARAAAPEDPIADVKHVILVMSGKGGVGKSTVCTNLALGLKRLGYRVGLLDADMYGPSIPTMLGITGRPLSNGSRIEPLQRFGISLMSIGFLLEDAKSAVVWRGPMLHAALLQFVKDVNWGKLDFLVIDMPPGTGDVSLTIAQNVKTTGAVIVTTPQEVALADVYKSASMNQKVGIPTLGVVENESYFICDGCDKRHFIFGEGGGKKIAEHTGAPLLAPLPLDPRIRQWGDAGTPVVQASPGSDVARSFLDLAAAVAARADELAGQAGTLTVDRSGGRNRHLPISR
jgi:ATP-binding protein involved in chromosome partitioning